MKNTYVAGNARQNIDNGTANPQPTDLNNQVDPANPYGDNNDPSYKKRFVNFQKTHTKAVHDLRKQIADLESKNMQVTPPSTNEEMDAFKEEHAEFYNVMETIAQQNASSQFESKFKSLESQNKELMIDKAFMEIGKQHPDYKTITASDDFQMWVLEQPSVIQSWVTEEVTDSSLAIRALDMYKVDAGITSSKKASPKKTSFDAADAVNATSLADVNASAPKIWKRSELRRMSASDFQKNMAELDKAALEGRIVEG